MRLVGKYLETVITRVLQYRCRETRLNNANYDDGDDD
jgi:hypothetical protein